MKTFKLVQPDISIIMTVLNGEAFLREAVESVLAQRTAYQWELLIVDDGSTDGTADVLRILEREDPVRIRVLRHDGGQNRGVSASRNLAMSHAMAPLLAFLDCDDVLLPGHLDLQIPLLLEHPEVAMVYASAERWVDHGLPFDQEAARESWWGSNFIPPLLPRNRQEGVIRPGELVRWMLADESFAPCICTVVVRRSAAEVVNGFEDEFHGLYDDQVFYAKVSSRFALYAHSACVARYRQHATSCCAKARSDREAGHAERQRFLAWLEDCSIEKAPASLTEVCHAEMCG